MALDLGPITRELNETKRLASDRLDELAIMRKVERHARRIVKGGDLETYRTLAKQAPGGGGKIFVSHAVARDLLSALKALDRYRAALDGRG